MNLKKKTYITCVGNPEDINVWSNIPFFFLEEGKRQNVFDGALVNYPEKFRFKRYLWNIIRLITFRKTGGFQFTSSFLSDLEHSVNKNQLSGRIITFNQLFPRAQTIQHEGGEIYYYIDCTLRQLFDAKSYGVKASSTIKKKAIELEKNNYSLAKKVVCMASHVKTSLIQDYNIPENKIEVIMPGANIHSLPPQPNSLSFNEGDVLKISFIGKDWERKGLLLLIKAVELLIKEDYKIRIETIGTNSELLSKYAFVKQHGFVNKQKELIKFIQLIQDCHLGVLLSESEALGISVLEYQALGVPVLGFDHEGMKDTISEKGGFKIPLTKNPTEIATILKNIIENPVGLNMKKESLKLDEASFLWSNTVSKWKEILLNE